MADSSLWGTLKTENRGRAKLDTAQGKRHIYKVLKKQEKQELSKSLEFIEPLRLSDEVYSSI